MRWIVFRYLSLAHSLIYFTVLLKGAGFSAAADATRVSVIIGLFKVPILLGKFLNCE